MILIIVYAVAHPNLRLNCFIGREGKRARTSSAPATSEDRETVHSDVFSKRGGSSRASDSDAFVLSDEEGPRPIGGSKRFSKGRPSSPKSKTSSSLASSDRDVFSDSFLGSGATRQPRSSHTK